jgi:uncharacterized coiled-coil DUF342 family protein
MFSMKIKVSEDTQRMLMLLKLDAQRVFERIKYRAPEYMYEFSLKRTRDHFPAVFKNRYDEIRISELMLCGPEVIAGLDQFYTKIDEIRWYLNHTQDMPNRVEDKVHSHIRDLETHFETLNLYIDVEMGLVKQQLEESSEINEPKN